MFTVIHTVLEGQDGNQGCSVEHIEGFPTKEAAQKYIEEECQQNGWHRYKIVEYVKTF